MSLIAVAAIHLAATDLSITLPENWWHLVTSDFGVILLLVDEIRGVYEWERVEWCQPFFPVDYMSIGLPTTRDRSNSPDNHERRQRSRSREKRRHRSSDRRRSRSRGNHHRSRSRERKYRHRHRDDHR